MSGEKTTIPLELNVDSQEMLSKIVAQYDLSDTSKAIRCLLDYVAEDGDWDTIFKKIRCRRC
ncbi:MAG: hypothetical protein CMM32_11585 [Rhodospirillaceae bacterium]|nr:hypothetical protein [Rhodospirillaceae bacterium]